MFNDTDMDEFSRRRAQKNPDQTMEDYFASHDALMVEAKRIFEGVEAIEAKWADKYPDVAHDLHRLTRDREWKP